MTWTPESEGPEYAAYHNQVVEACVALMGEHTRRFWEGCTYEQEYQDGLTPEECAEAQRESI